MNLNYNQILKINNLSTKDFIEFVKTLTPIEKTLVNRILMPSKITPILQPKQFKFAHGGRWGSKTQSFGKAFLNIANTEQCRILCTREVQNTLAESVHAELSSLIEDLEYDNFVVTDNSIFNTKTKSEFIFKGLQFQTKKQTVKSLSRVKYCWVEEAQSVSKASFDILIPTIRADNSEVWFSYNLTFPDDPVEILRQSIDENEKIDIFINAFDNPFNSAVTWKNIERLRKQYDSGENEDYLHVVMGQPIGLSEKTIFRLKEITDAMARTILGEGQIVVGIDIARMGGDKTIFIKRKGLKMIDYKLFPTMTGDVLLKEIIRFINNDVSVKINIDETGIAGGYITDWLHSQGFKQAESINFGRSAKENDKYNNAISEMWFEFKEKINEVELMNIPELKSQLITREYKYDNKERKCVEPKDSYKKRGYKSPDFADSILLCYYETGIKNSVTFW
jgi:phage terminase large subunit